jgi:hypothetical protein
VLNAKVNEVGAELNEIQRAENTLNSTRSFIEEPQRECQQPTVHELSRRKDRQEKRRIHLAEKTLNSARSFIEPQRECQPPTFHELSRRKDRQELSTDDEDGYRAISPSSQRLATQDLPNQELNKEGTGETRI